MSSHNLIQAARDLVESANPDDPHNSHFRRAISTAYYALFHCLAESSANLLAGEDPANRNNRAWLQTYRALNHGAVKNRRNRREFKTEFPQETQDFAKVFVEIRDKRNRADYDPTGSLSNLDAEQAIDDAEDAINDFMSIESGERRNFALYLLLPIRAD